MAIMVPDTPDKRDPPANSHKHFGLEHLGVRTDDIESVVKSSVAEGATVVQGITQVAPWPQGCFYHGTGKYHDWGF